MAHHARVTATTVVGPLDAMAVIPRVLFLWGPISFSIVTGVYADLGTGTVTVDGVNATFFLDFSVLGGAPTVVGYYFGSCAWVCGGVDFGGYRLWC